MATMNYAYTQRVIDGLGKILDTTPGTPDTGSYVTEQQLADWIKGQTIVFGYYYNGAFYEDSGHLNIITPQSEVIYIDQGNDAIYLYKGAAYVALTEEALRTELANGTFVPLKAKQDQYGNVIDLTYETKADANDLKNALGDYIPSISIYVPTTDISLVQVTSTATMRYGKDLGVLDAGTYVISHTGTTTDGLYITSIKEGVYSQENVTSSLKFTADGESDYIIRTASSSAWLFGNVTITNDYLSSTKIINTFSDIYGKLALSNAYNGKTMACIGDSITEGAYTNKEWPILVKERYGFASIENLSYAGKRYCRDGSGTNYRFTQMVKNITGNPDIIVVFGGTNDFGYNESLGSMSDVASDANGATFYASVKYTMEYLIDHYPNAKIIYFTPLQRYRDTSPSFNWQNTNNSYLFDYVDVIKKLASIYGVLCCDLFSDAEFHVLDETWRQTYTYDGLHPNTIGTVWFAEKAIYPFFDRKLLDFNSFNKNLFE